MTPAEIANKMKSIFFVLLFFSGCASAQRVSHITLPPYADTAHGLILGAHVNLTQQGTCLYDSLGRLLRVESGSCRLLEIVYENGKWIPYSKSKYAKRIK